MLETEKKPELPLEEKTQINHAQLHNSVTVAENDCLISTSESEGVVQGVVHEVVHEICKGDRDRLDNPGDVVQPIKNELPLIEEKGSYWSLSLKREVRVFQIYDEHSECSCNVPGRGTISLSFTDLQCCQKSPKHNLVVGDMVVILVGKHKESFATITTIRADVIWLKSDDRKKSLTKAYLPHQLVKA